MTSQWGRFVGLQLNPKVVNDPSRSHQQEVASCASPLKPTPLWSKPLGNLLGALIFIFLEISGVSEFPHSYVVNYYGCRIMAESCSLAPKELVLWGKLCVLEEFWLHWSEAQVQKVDFMSYSILLSIPFSWKYLIFIMLFVSSYFPRLWNWS